MKIDTTKLKRLERLETLRPIDVSQATGVPARAVAKATKAGHLRAVTVNGRAKYTRAAVVEWISQYLPPP